MSSLTTLVHALACGPAVLVGVVATRGSAPRDAGAWLALTASGLVGTVGGGRLEQDALVLATDMLKAHVEGQATPAREQRFALGPSLGQCCGGEVLLRLELVQQADAPALQARLAPRHWPLGLFGGGHVGQALIQVLARLPFDVTWVDSRDGVFPQQVPANVCCEHSDPVQAAVAALPPGARVVVMSFSHAEDLDIVAACLIRQRARGDLPYIGLIGSHTKWATFRRRLAERGFADAELAHVTCPIGVPVVKDKRPEIIAVAVAAQLLQVAEDTVPDPAPGAAGT
ncbi:MAG: xanthine dehydrogenase accessory protein XdhC [Rhodoferax sp.]|nr:xanthine dehydrogenase accessory protein XdhC [Rhodoferax sp.]